MTMCTKTALVVGGGTRVLFGVAKKQVIFGFVKLKGSDDDGICPIYYHVTIE